MRVLILSPDPSRQGGVRDFVETFKRHLGSAVEAESFIVGRGAGVFSGVAGMFLDALRLLFSGAAKKDVVHLNPSLNRAIVREALAMLALRLIGARHVLVFIHGWDLTWEKRIDGSAFWQWVFRRVYGRAACIVVLAERFKNKLVDWGIEAARIRVMSTFFEGAQFDGLQRFRDDDREVQLLFLSRFVRAKGGYEVIEAFSRLLPKYPGLRLICAGDGPDAAGMKALVAALGIVDKVSFPGFVRGNAKAQLLLDSDVFAFPTYYGEGCPVSLLEAMAAGLPVLTADAGGIPDIFEDGQNGVLLRQVNVDTVESGLLRLLGDETMRRAIGLHNRAEAWIRYESEPVSQQLIGFYRDIASPESGLRDITS